MKLTANKLPEQGNKMSCWFDLGEMYKSETLNQKNMFCGFILFKKWCEKAEKRANGFKKNIQILDFKN